MKSRINNHIFYNMQTRSQTRKLNEKQNVLEFDYDFDYSSKCWKSNKKPIGNGCYKYIWCKIHAKLN
jgi:hypothetical protein